MSVINEYFFPKFAINKYWHLNESATTVSIVAVCIIIVLCRSFSNIEPTQRRTADFLFSEVWFFHQIIVHFKDHFTAIF